MRVPARFYSDERLLKGVVGDRSLDQLVNTACLPGVVKHALAMPDMHQGYGFPIGGVVATRLPDGVISPGGVGYDINCGVRLLGSQLEKGQIAPYLDELAAALHASCPSGVGKGGQVRLSPKALDAVLDSGSRWALKNGFATDTDLEHTEEGGCLPGAGASGVSQRAKQRGQNQIGTLGAGNHFIEVDEVDHIYDEKAARQMGLFPGQIAVQVHCGSRGLGHQVCSDYVKAFQKSSRQYGYRLPDRELVCAPLDSPEGEAYLAAMQAAANYAFVNRQLLADQIRKSFERVLAGRLKRFQLFQIYDIAHNMAKIETHRIAGRPTRVCVHRKGATRAFGPQSPELPDTYRAIGQPVLVPGSMGTASYVLTGTRRAMRHSFGSCCHGAGRRMSRKQARKSVQAAALRDELASKGIRIRAGSMAGLAEEAPAAYKDVDRVVAIVHKAGIARLTARLKPMVVIKG
jgi:tRNA-splicing ligase RtcB